MLFFAYGAICQMEITQEIYPHSRKDILSQKRSVFIIDDSVDTLEVHKIILESHGFEVFTAQSGIEALDVLSQIAKPCLILLDMQMDGMTGSDFLTILEEKKPEIVKDVPIVFVSAMDTVPKSKAAGFIRKPIDTENFLEAVHRFIDLGDHPPFHH